MKKPKLNYWKKVDDLMVSHKEYPSVTLEYESPLYGEITPNGIMQIKTTSRGGHGSPKNSHQGLLASDWICLIEEAKGKRLINPIYRNDF